MYSKGSRKYALTVVVTLCAFYSAPFKNVKSIYKNGKILDKRLLIFCNVQLTIWVVHLDCFRYMKRTSFHFQGTKVITNN
jgi:hypothetical protein